MTPDRYTAISQEAGQRYQGVISTLRSLLLTAQAKPFSASRINVLRNSAKSAANTYLGAEREHIRTSLAETAQEAVRSSQDDAEVSGDIHLPLSFQSYVEASERFLESEVKTQLSRDVEALIKRYREFAVQADYVSRSGHMPLSQAMSNVGVFRDRVGRSSSAQTYVSAAWRLSLVTLAAEFYMLDSASRGVTKFAVQHPDPASRHTGRVIDMNDPKFLQVRDEVFHPNSIATLKAA